MKRIISILLVTILLLSGCGASEEDFTAEEFTSRGFEDNSSSNSDYYVYENESNNLIMATAVRSDTSYGEDYSLTFGAAVLLQDNPEMETDIYIEYEFIPGYDDPILKECSYNNYNDIVEFDLDNFNQIDENLKINSSNEDSCEYAAEELNNIIKDNGFDEQLDFAVDYFNFKSDSKLGLF